MIVVVPRWIAQLTPLPQDALAAPPPLGRDGLGRHAYRLYIGLAAAEEPVYRAGTPKIPVSESALPGSTNVVHRPCEAALGRGGSASRLCQTFPTVAWLLQAKGGCATFTVPQSRVAMASSVPADPYPPLSESTQNNYAPITQRIHSGRWGRGDKTYNTSVRGTAGSANLGTRQS